MHPCLHRYAFQEECWPVGLLPSAPVANDKQSATYCPALSTHLTGPETRSLLCRYHFKISLCSKRFNHDWNFCPYAHTGGGTMVWGMPPVPADDTAAQKAASARTSLHISLSAAASQQLRHEMRHSGR